jgi:hypothetical protein
VTAETRGYPYFLQEWGKHSWDVAKEPPIVANDVERASTSAIAFYRRQCDLFQEAVG